MQISFFIYNLVVTIDTKTFIVLTKNKFSFSNFEWDDRPIVEHRN